MATSSFIPKAELNAYQRWEMNALDAPDPIPEEHDQQLNTEDNTLVDEQNKITLPTEEEISAILQHAKTEGYAAGYQEGNAAGYAAGRKAAEIEVTTEVARLQTLLSNLDQDLHTIDQHVADDLLGLAIALTKKMVTQALQLKPELIAPIVQEAIRNLPSAMQHPRLYLHPDDAKIVHAHLGDQLAQDSWSIREDEQLSQGGCRIEANGSEIDASLEVRWQRVLSAIGQNDSWLEKND
ncbi:flagellar assembly protein FliH [Nitrosomonas sp.]|uniref:flagellar assembly protein FliH n=1 Tax=Nitrosomonas sp. TaxID=42353 RepID=UPI00262303B6|nr:flagellar assembly protein FliH [Nitrosomonas sp.]